MVSQRKFASEGKAATATPLVNYLLRVLICLPVDSSDLNFKYCKNTMVSENERL